MALTVPQRTGQSPAPMDGGAGIGDGEDVAFLEAEGLHPPVTNVDVLSLGSGVAQMSLTDPDI